MYEVVIRDDFKNPADYDKCRKEFFETLPNNVIEYGMREQFDVDCEDDSNESGIAEDIFSRYEWK